MTLMNERRAQTAEKEKAGANPESARIAARYLMGDNRPVPWTFSNGGGASASSVETAQLVTIGTQTLRLPVSEPPGAFYFYSKRATDVAAAATLLLVLFVPMLMVALLIVLEDGGPIFYYQTRVGRNGNHFKFYKFRSMVRNADALKAQLETQNEADGPIFKMEKDPRVTRIGRWIRRYSVDELPQLLNVLRGEMSLVGPRPHLPKEVALYSERQQERLTVQPGLLCFREVFGRSKMTFEEWIELDLLYIRHRSLRTDLRIMLRTIPAVLKGEGAY